MSHAEDHAKARGNKFARARGHARWILGWKRGGNAGETLGRGMGEVGEREMVGVGERGMVGVKVEVDVRVEVRVEVVKVRGEVRVEGETG